MIFNIFHFFLSFIVGRPRFSHKSLAGAGLVGGAGLLGRLLGVGIGDVAAHGAASSVRDVPSAVAVPAEWLPRVRGQIGFVLGSWGRLGWLSDLDVGEESGRRSVDPVRRGRVEVGSRSVSQQL